MEGVGLVERWGEWRGQGERREQGSLVLTGVEPINVCMYIYSFDVRASTGSSVTKSSSRSQLRCRVVGKVASLWWSCYQRATPSSPPLVMVLVSPIC